MKVMVTGSSRGIGKAIAEIFLTKGDSVIGIDRQVAGIEHPEYTHYVCDVRDRSNLPDIDGVNVLINNAGISITKLFTETTDEDYFNIMNTNFGGMFFVTREVARKMISAHNGRIINIGSMWGKVGASCEVAYSASKAAVEGFTKALAKELGPSGICVNCVEPGVIDTDMNSSLDENTMCELCDETPLCRMGSSRDVADAVLFFASDKASFITGQCLGVDGGFGL